MKIGLAVILLLACLLSVTSCGRVDRSGVVVIWEHMEPIERVLCDRHIELFREAHPEFAHIEIQRVHFRVEDLRTQFQTAALAEAGPNLVYAAADVIGPFQIMGLIRSLDGFLDAEEFARFDRSALPTLHDSVYGLPDQVGNHLTLTANGGLVDSIPDNTDEWVEQLRELTRDEDEDGRPEIYGLVYNMIEPFWLVPWLGGFGGWVLTDDGTPTLDSEGMAGALCFLRSLRDLGVVPLECDYPQADTLFKEGRAAYIINGPWCWSGYQDLGIDVKLGPIPRVSSTGLWPSPMTSAKCYMVNRFLDPATVECTRALLRFLTSAEAQAALAREMGVLPADLSARTIPGVADDPLQVASRDQIVKGRIMPIIPEMRLVWDAMRPAYQSVLNGGSDCATAGARMQAKAEKDIREMKQ